jgi:hypothetical protein
MELLLPRLTSVGPGCGANSLWGSGYSCQVQAWSRPLLQHSHAPLDERVEEEVVLLEEQCLRTAPYVYQ